MTESATIMAPKQHSCTRRTRVKLCGLCSEGDVDLAVALGADAIGLVFYPPSPRCVSIELASALVRRIPAFVSVVGLFVNADNTLFERVIDEVPLGILQFHGDETPQRCKALADRAGLRWLRTLHISPDTKPTDLDKLALNYACATGLLFDTLVAGYGGGGKVFDWSLIPAKIAHRGIFSGGLNSQNVANVIHRIRPYAVDVSSGIEVANAKGVKDYIKMAAFIHAVRAADEVSSAIGTP
ncbi:phosphoribosylanthranilate isomerase [Candidatus Vallotia lariciata]|uniref:phosphoribosylanthranilate isomerase n=1 Tax=Candidatus Vallotia laricis TaxID=2018052 RepID=UPI001D020C02|nr:phosphoribosylanthranilate isomerase [Candidatus Vallotia lariciata]UDG82964.1 N-(5'-phosphoribosyl)anthranilate isomerase [Candidatus Vallotia lariciata]